MRRGDGKLCAARWRPPKLPCEIFIAFEMVEFLDLEATLSKWDFYRISHASSCFWWSFLKETSHHGTVHRRTPYFLLLYGRSDGAGDRLLTMLKCCVCLMVCLAC
jgi:hypothetical protein